MKIIEIVPYNENWPREFVEKEIPT